jgi:hypothetical protein
VHDARDWRQKGMGSYYLIGQFPLWEIEKFLEMEVVKVTHTINILMPQNCTLKSYIRAGDIAQLESAYHAQGPGFNP